MADDEDVSAGKEPTEDVLADAAPAEAVPVDETSTEDVPTDGVAPDEVSTDDASSESEPDSTSEPASGKASSTNLPWAAIVVGAIALVVMSGVLVWSILPAPVAPLPASWTASAGAAASTARASAARTTASSSKASASASAIAATSGFPSSTTCVSGQTMGTTAWTATVPVGWTCASGAGTASFYLRSDTADVISAGLSTARDAASACSSPFGAQAATVQALPDTTWGGRKAVTVDATFASGAVVHYRCVAGPSGVYIMGGVVVGSTATLTLGMDALAAGWVWK